MGVCLWLPFVCGKILCSVPQVCRLLQWDMKVKLLLRSIYTLYLWNQGWEREANCVHTNGLFQWHSRLSQKTAFSFLPISSHPAAEGWCLPWVLVLANLFLPQHSLWSSCADFIILGMGKGREEGQSRLSAHWALARPECTRLGKNCD